MSNWASSQVRKKHDHLDQNEQWILINLDVQSNWTKQNNILSQGGQWYNNSQVGYPMSPNWLKWLLPRLNNSLGLFTYLPTYHLTNLPTQPHISHLPSYIPTYLLTSYFPSMIFHPYSPTYLPTCLPTFYFPLTILLPYLLNSYFPLTILDLYLPTYL